MPANASKQPGDVILASEWNTLATTANNGESGATAAAAAASAANTLAGQKYTATSADIVRWGAAVCVSSTTSRVPGSACTLFIGADPGAGATAGVDLWVGDLAP